MNCSSSHFSAAVYFLTCRHALAEHAAHFVEVYRSQPSDAARADALYFIGMLKDSPRKRELLGQVQ